MSPLQIPSVLTDEAQLRRLDAWTREAIDERLRVLDDVQQSLWRAAAELQRVRSTLPPPTPTSQQQSPSSPIVSTTASASASARVKGKGRAVFDVQEELEEEEFNHHTAAAMTTTDGFSAGSETIDADRPFPSVS